MHLRTPSLPALLAGAVLACLLTCVGGPLPAALAATPATVSVRVEGLAETKLPATAVSTTATPVVKDGNPEDSCSGTSALGALQDATAGNWSGPWNTSFHQYEIYSVLGETHLFEPSSTANYFWSLWVDDRESEVGACEAELSAGDRVLFFPSCFGSSCPPEQLPLEVQASATTANIGEPVSFMVKRYTRTGEGTPVQGAALAGGGASGATGPSGQAQLTFASPGQVTVAVSATGGVRTEAQVCIHAGSDGTCGTAAPGRGEPEILPPAPAPYKGPYALVAGVKSVIEHHTYSSHGAPRLLAGTVTGHSAVTSVSLRLRRSSHGRCWVYDGRRTRFTPARCSTAASYFKVATGATFSYLLPAALAPGRYVLDILATDAAGNRTALARGSTRTVFFVR